MGLPIQRTDLDCYDLGVAWAQASVTLYRKVKNWDHFASAATPIKRLVRAQYINRPDQTAITSYEIAQNLQREFHRTITARDEHHGNIFSLGVSVGLATYWFGGVEGHPVDYYEGDKAKSLSLEAVGYVRLDLEKPSLGNYSQPGNMRDLDKFADWVRKSQPPPFYMPPYSIVRNFRSSIELL